MIDWDAEAVRIVDAIARGCHPLGEIAPAFGPYAIKSLAGQLRSLDSRMVMHRAAPPTVEPVVGVDLEALDGARIVLAEGIDLGGLGPKSKRFT